MTVKEAVALFRYHQKSTLKQRTIKSYNCILNKFVVLYAERTMNSIGTDEIYTFLESLKQHSAKSSRRLRYAQLKAFYNFIIENCDMHIKNPCDSPLLKKHSRWQSKRQEKSWIGKQSMR